LTFSGVSATIVAVGNQ